MVVVGFRSGDSDFGMVIAFVVRMSVVFFLEQWLLWMWSF